MAKLTDDQIKQIYYDGWLAGIAHGARLAAAHAKKVSDDVDATNYDLTEQDWAAVLPELRDVCDDIRADAKLRANARAIVANAIKR